MRLQGRPSFRAGASVEFASFTDAAEATRLIAQSGLHPSNCRLLDHDEALLSGSADGTHAILVLGFESADHPVTAGMARALELCRDHGGVPTAPARYTDVEDQDARSGAADSWRSSFLRMPYQRDALAAQNPGVLIDPVDRR